MPAKFQPNRTTRKKVIAIRKFDCLKTIKIRNHLYYEQFFGFSQKALIFQINGLWIRDMYNIIGNISKI